MTPQEIKKAVEYKQGHFNMVQYILKEKPEWSISVISRDDYEYSVEKSKDYEKIRKAIKAQSSFLYFSLASGDICLSHTKK